MPTWTAYATLAEKTAAERLGAALEELDPAPTGVGVFEMEDGSGLWEVGGYFTEAPDEVALALLAAATGAGEFAISELPETDWVAKVRRELAPVEAGRFVVYGSHDADRVPADRIGLLIEASMAFGTGHHGTTLGCLRAYDALLESAGPPGRVADIGCGTAVLAMAAAATGADQIVAGDIDAVAVDVARANLAANGLAGRVRCVEAAGFGHPALQGPFDLIFANILKGPLLDLAPEIAARLAPGGHAILSGLLDEQADEVRRVYQREGLNPLSETQIVDWTTIVLHLDA